MSEHLRTVGLMTTRDASRTMTLDEAREFITDWTWTYAKTMPQWPHEYIIKEKRPDQAQRFEAFVRLILTEGKLIPWPEDSPNPRYHNIYLVIDAFKYWSMGPGGGQDRGARDDAEDRNCVNRAMEPDPGQLPSHLAFVERRDARGT